MAEAAVNDTRLYYIEDGSGVPCLVMHGGLGLDHTLYKRSLGSLAEDCRLLFYDQRGNGRSERPPLETITIPQLAEDAEALRQHLNLESMTVMGHSYGGFVALEYATRYPERLSHLILLDTSPGVFEPTADELAERGDDSWITPQVRHALEVFGGPPPVDDEDFASKLAEMAPAYMRTISPEVLLSFMEGAVLDAKAMIRGFEVLEGWSVVDKLERITCPTLVVCGRYDLFTPPECSKRLATAIPGAELVWFEQSGHMPWLEEPDAFFDSVKDFLRRCQP
jgi:proline iminopeptidase